MTTYTEGPPRDYWSDGGVLRQRILWATCTRRQLDRWEPLVARNIASEWKPPPLPELTPVEFMQMAHEHHFVLIAARNLLHALEMPPASRVAVPAELRAEIIEGRDLLEHWKDNAPVFNVTPRPEEPPRRSGKDFAARHPTRSPYCWWAWNNQTGPMLLPGVAAFAVRELAERVEAEVVADTPEFAKVVPPREPSVWAKDDYGWWPNVAILTGQGEPLD